MAILDDTRADWNARPPLRTLTRVPWAQRIGVSWHWIGPGKGPSAAGPHSACLAQVRDWQWQHQHKPAPDGPWKDLGYNVLICQHARAIEGRGLEFSGSHSPGVNVEHVGIQLMVGEDTPGGATPAMFARAVRLRADIGALGKNIRRDWRHRDDPKASTACCGPQIGAWVISGGPIKNAPTTPSPALQEDNMPNPEDLWDFPTPRPGNTDSPAGAQLGQANVNSYRALAEVRALRPLVEAIAAKLLDPAEVEAAAKAGAAAALDERITGADVTLEVKP